MITIDANTLYFTDNGAVYCGEHLGATAKATGRDISGQRIEVVTPEYVEEGDSLGVTFECDRASCDRKARQIYV